MLKRLADQGLAERVELRVYLISPDATKKDFKAARKSRKPVPS